MNSKRFALALCALCLTLATALAAPRSKQLMKSAAALAINKQRSTKKLAPRNNNIKVLKETTAYEIIGYEEGGFAVVGADDLVPEVLGVSTARYSQGENTNFNWWLQAMNAAIEHAVQNNTKLETTTPDPTRYPSTVTPLLTSTWGQQAPYNNMCPIASGNTRCVTGCVATAMAQVLYFHKVPAHGIGTRTIYYPQGDYTGTPVTANFGEDFYDWENMLDHYNDGQYNNTQANAVALLMRDCGVAADMEYGSPSVGSGAYSEDAAEGLRDYFGFEDAECLSRDSYSEQQWMNIVYRELSENGPLMYGGSSYYDGGHAFVLHGYNAEGKVYVNWGWNGDDDGYYDISLLNPAGMSFAYGQDMIVGISSNNYVTTRETEVEVAEAGLLKQTIEAQDDTVAIASLTITGELNHSDLKYLRHLAGRDTIGESTQGRLRNLVLTNATLPNNMLPDSIFKNCSQLSRVCLPASLERIGKEAFMGCRGLVELRVPTTSVPQLDGPDVFEEVPMGTAKLYVRNSTRTKFMQSALWGAFGSKNIIGVGTTVKVRNAIRKYGEENPKFFYLVTGDAITGEPVMKCEATATSPAGRYPVTIERGTIENDVVDFVDGFMIVQKLNAKATVRSYTREQGQPNPEFDFESFEGLLDLEQSPVWAEQPVITTTANENSPVGEYPIVVESGMAESYNMTFVEGTLTVTTPTGIDAPTVAEKHGATHPQQIHDLSGRQLHGATVNTLKPGLYIVNGRKMMMK